MLTVVVLYASIMGGFIYKNDVLGRFGLCHTKIVYPLLLKKEEEKKRKEIKKRHASLKKHLAYFFFTIYKNHVLFVDRDMTIMCTLRDTECTGH